MTGKLIVCTGPRAVGKTSFCENLLPPTGKTLAILSRDKFFEERYGRDVWDPYTGLMNVAEKEYALKIARMLYEYDMVFADCFMGSPKHLAAFLKVIIEDLDLQPEIVVFLLHAPKSLCSQQFIDRESLDGDSKWKIAHLKRCNNNDWDLFNERFQGFGEYTLSYRDGTFEGVPIDMSVQHICASQKSFLPAFFV